MNHRPIIGVSTSSPQFIEAVESSNRLQRHFEEKEFGTPRENWTDEQLKVFVAMLDKQHIVILQNFSDACTHFERVKPHVARALEKCVAIYERIVGTRPAFAERPAHKFVCENPPDTAEGALVYLERAKKEVRAAFEANGYMSLQAIIIGRRNPNDGIYSETPLELSTLAEEIQSHQDKEDFIWLTRDLVDDVDACCCIVVMEAWGTKPPEGVDRDEWFRRYPDFSKAPNRTEEIMLIFDHIIGKQRLFFAQITRDGSGKPSLGDWVEVEDGTNFGGEFMHIMPRRLQRGD